MSADADIAELRAAALNDPDPNVAGRLFNVLQKNPELLTRADVDLLASRLRDPGWARAVVVSQGFGADYKLAGLYRARPDLFTPDEGAEIEPHWSLLVGMQTLAGIGLAGGFAYGVQRWGLSEPHPGLVLSVAVGVGLTLLPWLVLESMLRRWAHRRALDRAARKPER